MYLVAKKTEAGFDFTADQVVKKTAGGVYGDKMYVPKKHETYADAEAVARQKAASQPGSEYAVFGPLSGFKTEPAPVQQVPYPRLPESA